MMEPLETALAQVAVNLRAMIRDTRDELEAFRALANSLAADSQQLEARTHKQAEQLGARLRPVSRALPRPRAARPARPMPRAIWLASCVRFLTKAPRSCIR